MAESLVKRFDINIRISINEYATEDGSMFDWRANNGSESDELFDTAKDAEWDARSYFGG